MNKTTGTDLTGFGNLSGLNKTAAPKLRFPEFQDAPEWENPTLEEVSIPVVERVGDRKLTPISISAGIGFVPQAEKFGRDISGNQYRFYTLARDGDFVYNKGNSLKFPQGCVYILRNWGEVAAPNVFICFRLKDGYINNFFQNCFERNMHGVQLQKHITSGARSNGLLNISKDTFFGIRIPTPSTAEQQKIADCLTSLDAWIAAQSQKMETLKAYKKGLMQNLFPAEGESVPRLRFPEFESAGEWEEMQFGDILQINSGKGFKASEYSNNGIRLLQIENVGYGKVKWSENTIYLSKDYVKKYPDLILRQGDIVLALNRPVTNNELKIAQLQKHDEPSLLYQRVGKVEKISNSITENFIFHLCQKIVKNFVIKKSIGSDQPFISLKELYAQMIFVPAPSEQQRIAELLSAVDEQIAAQSEKVAALKVHKQGLMQGLFPSVQT
jgi:type I restriction enzyme S subunit